MTGVCGVVFDLDGTLVDGYDGIASGVNAARAAFGLPTLSIEDVRGRVGLGLSHLMNDVLGKEHAEAGAVIFREVYARVCEAETRPAPGLVRVLSALAHRGFRMSVASNKPAEFSMRILERLGASPYFDAIEGPETAGAAKPEPQMIFACLHKMGIAPEQALYVGDMPIDKDAGARAGVPVVLVSGGSSPNGALRATGCPVLPALSDLLDVLPEIAPRVS